MEGQRFRSSMRTSLPLHASKVQQPAATINRVFTLVRSMNILALIYYRASRILMMIFSSGGDGPPLLPHLPWLLMIFTAELIFSFFFILNQAFFWHPVSRTAFPERLSTIVGDEELPGVDVFICTADPKKEPIVEVMNTVLSALCLDYPQNKLSVYLSDDAGSPLTLYAIRESSCFARSWLIFCRKYGIKTICPEAYIATTMKNKRRSLCDFESSTTTEFMAEEENIKSKYKAFKERLERAAVTNHESPSSKHDRPPLIEVIHDDHNDAGIDSTTTYKMPRLVYIAREKRIEHPHHFKAGALNVLLRVSGIISNAPYILVLDCDMYCNDPTSARQAMCFHLDPQINSSLAFVQFPQMFYSISHNDIYDGQLRTAFKSKWQGMDGAQGPGLSGTGFYLKRRAVYSGLNQNGADIDLHELKHRFGSSNMFIRSLNKNYSTAGAIDDQVLLEVQILASCDYEKETKWGKEIGFLYQCKLESTFTGYYLHCQGWKSVYIYPPRPSFLGCPTLNMNDKFTQTMKWSSELLLWGFSGSLSPLTYGLSRLPLMQNMFYTYIALTPFASISLLLYATIPQLCLLTPTPLFPKVSDPWFAVFAIAFVAYFVQQLYETEGSLRTCWNEMRIWMIMSVTGKLYGCLDALKKTIGINKASLSITNKTISQEELEKYKRGEFNLHGTATTLLPLIIFVMLNAISFVVGVQRMIRDGSYDIMFGQAFLSLFLLIVSYPVLKAIVLEGTNK